jgi:hypothetical protein
VLPTARACSSLWLLCFRYADYWCFLASRAHMTRAAENEIHTSPLSMSVVSCDSAAGLSCSEVPGAALAQRPSAVWRALGLPWNDTGV